MQERLEIVAMLNGNCTHTIGLAEAREHRGSTWQDWLGTGRRLLVRDTRALFDLFTTWQQRSSARYRLKAMDDRLLKDIGLSRADVERESSKPFWRA